MQEPPPHIAFINQTAQKAMAQEQYQSRLFSSLATVQYAGNIGAKTVVKLAYQTVFAPS